MNLDPFNRGNNDSGGTNDIFELILNPKVGMAVLAILPVLIIGQALESGKVISVLAGLGLMAGAYFLVKSMLNADAKDEKQRRQLDLIKKDRARSRQYKAQKKSGKFPPLY